MTNDQVTALMDGVRLAKNLHLTTISSLRKELEKLGYSKEDINIALDYWGFVSLQNFKGELK